MEEIRRYAFFVEFSCRGECKIGIEKILDLERGTKFLNSMGLFVARIPEVVRNITGNVYCLTWAYYSLTSSDTEMQRARNHLTAALLERVHVLRFSRPVRGMKGF